MHSIGLLSLDKATFYLNMGPGPIVYHVNPILQYEFVSSNPETQQTGLQYMLKTWGLQCACRCACRCASFTNWAAFAIGSTALAAALLQKVPLTPDLDRAEPQGLTGLSHKGYHLEGFL